MTPEQFIIKYRPCRDAVEWLRQGKFRSLAQAGDKCPNIFWLAWCLGTIPGVCQEELEQSETIINYFMDEGKGWVLGLYAGEITHMPSANYYRKRIPNPFRPGKSKQVKVV